MRQRRRRRAPDPFAPGSTRSEDTCGKSSSAPRFPWTASCRRPADRPRIRPRGSCEPPPLSAVLPLAVIVHHSVVCAVCEPRRGHDRLVAADVYPRAAGASPNARSAFCSSDGRRWNERASGFSRHHVEAGSSTCLVAPAGGLMTNTQTLAPARQLVETNKAHFPMRAQNIGRLGMRFWLKRLSSVATSSVSPRSAGRFLPAADSLRISSWSPTKAPFAYRRCSATRHADDLQHDVRPATPGAVSDVHIIPEFMERDRGQSA